MSEINENTVQESQTHEAAGLRPESSVAPHEQRLRQRRETRRWLFRLAIQPLLFIGAGALLIAPFASER